MPVEIDGAVELKRAMELFTPSLARNMENRIGDALIPIVADARGYVPGAAPLTTWQKYSVNNWGAFPRYDAQKIRQGIVYSTEPTKPNRSGFSYAASIRNKTGVGAIYETAGRKNPNGRKQAPTNSKSKRYSRSANPNAGRQFIQALPPLVDARSYYFTVKQKRNMKGRLIYRAWAKDQGKAYDAVNRAISDSIKEFRKHAISKATTTMTYRKAA